MKILFITTKNKNFQGDYLELTILNGLRKILGDNFIDFPRKKISYHDWAHCCREECGSCCEACVEDSFCATTH